MNRRSVLIARTTGGSSAPARAARSRGGRYAEGIIEGIEACPEALAGLQRGDKGKRIIRLKGELPWPM